MGSFTIPKQRIDDIQTLPFPTLRADMPRYEDAPLDLFVLPARANPRMMEVKLLLAYLGRPEVQLRLNHQLGTFSPTGKASNSSPPFKRPASRCCRAPPVLPNTSIGMCRRTLTGPPPPSWPDLPATPI